MKVTIIFSFIFFAISPHIMAQEASLKGGLENCSEVSSMKVIQNIDLLIYNLNEFGEKTYNQIQDVYARCGNGTYEERCKAAKSNVEKYEKDAMELSQLKRRFNLNLALGKDGADAPACLAEIIDSIKTFDENIKLLKSEYSSSCIDKSRAIGCN